MRQRWVLQLRRNRRGHPFVALLPVINGTLARQSRSQDDLAMTDADSVAS